MTSRQRLTLTTVLLCAAGMLLFLTLHVANPGRVTPTAPRTTGTQAEAGWSWLSALLRSRWTHTTRVRFEVMDEKGLPLEGIRLTLQEHPGGVTDASGELILHGVPWGNGWSEPTVEGPWLVLDGTTEGRIWGAFQTRFVLLRPACPGVVRLVDEEGRPVQGATIYPVVLADASTAGWVSPARQTDGVGEVTFPNRPCGLVSFDVDHKASGDIPWITTEVIAGEPAVLTLPRVFQGVLAVVDEGDVPVEAEVDSPKGLSIERLGKGLFNVRARRPMHSLSVSAEGYLRQGLRMPLDGGEHVYRLVPGHEVEVSVLCEKRCPEELSCDGTPCQEDAVDRFVCQCPARETRLFDRAMGAVGVVQADEEEITLDLRRDASVWGRWTGPLPCDVSGGPFIGFRETGYCASDGSFYLDSLTPGWTTITVRHGLEDQGGVYLELKAGESVALGDIGPTDEILDGLIDADFALAGATLLSTPRCRVVLFQDGSFQLHGLPQGTTEIALHLLSSMYGSFEETFIPTEQGSLPTWRISEREAAYTTPLEDLLDEGYGDTGCPADLEEDTGMTGENDSGAEETGVPWARWGT